MTRVAFVRLEDDLVDKLDQLAHAMHRPRSWLIEQAIRGYVEEQAGQVQAIQEALDDYRSGHATLVPHEEVMERLQARINATLES